MLAATVKEAEEKELIDKIQQLDISILLLDHPANLDVFFRFLE